MKKYVLIVSKRYLKGHHRAGDETKFNDKIIAGTKIHTIRENFDYWNKRVIQIERGNGYLSLRNWSGEPYKSTQEEFVRLTAVGIQKLDIVGGRAYIDEIALLTEEHLVLAKNDGFDFNADGLKDFIHWLGANKKDVRNAALIHFTPFRYGQR